MNCNIIHFNSWFSMHYNILRTDLCKFEYDTDTLHECYIDVYENLLQRKDIIECFTPLFLSFYRKIRRNMAIHESRYMRPSEVFFQMLASDPPKLNQDKCDPVRLVELVLERERKKMGKRDYALFKLYMQGCTVRDISDYTGVSMTKVSRTLNAAKREIRNDGHLKQMFNLIQYDYGIDYLR